MTGERQTMNASKMATQPHEGAAVRFGSWGLSNTPHDPKHPGSSTIPNKLSLSGDGLYSPVHPVKQSQTTMATTTETTRVREAACMVRAMKASCPVPRSLPSQQVLRLAAWNLRLRLPDALRSKDVKSLRGAGLTGEYASALVRAFPDRQAADRLATAAALMMAGMAPRMVAPALEAFGDEAVHRAARDPYGAIRELKGGTLEDADALARGWSFDDRVVGHVRWHLLCARRDGHTMLPTLLLLGKLKVRLDRPLEDIRGALARAVAPGGALALVGAPDADEGITEPEALAVETRLAADITKRAACTFFQKKDDSSRGGLEGLTADQVAAAEVIRSASITVLTGGPGTGKSTVVRALVAELGEERCLLTAPTGRAARNVGGNTVHSASGGRLLRRRPLQETSKADIPDDLLLMVVDESSMLTTELMVGVLSLAPPQCHVVLVGDADQLPPVGPGNVLRDLIESGAVPVARLSHNHRCSHGIQDLARGVLAGAVPPALLLAAGPSVRMAEASTDSEAKSLAVGAVVRGGAQILSPQNAQRSLYNRAVQSAVMPQVGVLAAEACTTWGIPAGTPGCIRTTADGQSTLHAGGKAVSMPVGEMLSVTRPPCGGETLLVGDSVMVLKNQNKKRVAAGETSACNGDIGTLTRGGSGGGGGKAVVDFGEAGTAEFPKAEGWLTLAYASTVHKFQGSECDAVALPIFQGSSWDRTLLYTAITRARTSVTLIGTLRDLQSAVSRTRGERHSILRRLLGA